MATPEGFAVRLFGTVSVDGVPGTGTPRTRTLLGVLALTPQVFVNREKIIDVLWGEALPRRPGDALSVQATRLRSWLGPDRLANAGGGYVLQVDPDLVDVARFDTAADRALSPTGTIGDVDAALTEWAGEPLGGCVPSPWLDVARRRLADRRLELVERRAQLLLAADRPQDVLAALVGEVAEHRDRQHLTVLLATALTRVGRPAEARGVAEATEAYLRDEQGLDPGDELRLVLRRLRALTPRRAPTPLIGRDDLIARLEDASGGLVVVEGEAGIGKSALLRAVVGRARARGDRAGTGVCDEDGIPLSGWREACAELGEPGIRMVAPLLRARLAGKPAQTTRPTLLVLDDAHRADSASLELLVDLARLGLPGGVTLLAAARAGRHRPPRLGRDAGRPAP